MLKDRVTIRNKIAATTFGDTTGYRDAATVWACVTWSKGVKAMREGALDAYDTVLVRMRWNSVISRDSLIVYNGTIFQILSFHIDKMDNTVQITAQEVVR